MNELWKKKLNSVKLRASCSYKLIFKCNTVNTDIYSARFVRYNIAFHDSEHHINSTIQYGCQLGECHCSTKPLVVLPGTCTRLQSTSTHRLPHTHYAQTTLYNTLLCANTPYSISSSTSGTLIALHIDYNMRASVVCV